ncbi:glucoamylase family protein [Jatrophihabitans sp. YIM 134969]
MAAAWRRSLVLVPMLVAGLTVSRAVAASPAEAAPGAPPAAATSGLTPDQAAELLQIARDTWRFFGADVDPVTALPLDHLGPGTVRGGYTSAANIGVYLWSVVSAADLGLVSRADATALAAKTLRTVARMSRSHGLLYQWYDTATAAVISNPGEPACPTNGPRARDNCSFLSAVDNGWYASGLFVARQALPGLRPLIARLTADLDFSIFYDDRPQTNCNVNADLGGQPTGQQYGGYYVGSGPADYHNGALYSDPRISMYIGMGLNQMPGDVWWRTWRTLPPRRCSTDPSNASQGQWPAAGRWVTYTDPRSHKAFKVWEGHYTYPGTDLDYLPTFAGGMFEGLMANLVVPETTWGPNGLGRADALTVQVHKRYALETLGFPVWGLSPSSTADDTGGYGIYGVGGLQFPARSQLAICPTCATETAVTPHASFLALDVAPVAAYRNIANLRRLYPGVYSAKGGFFDAVNPLTGQVGHRRLVLDQSMIMAALADVLTAHGGPRRWFAEDPASHAARTYLGIETMTLSGAGPTP